MSTFKRFLGAAALLAVLLTASPSAQAAGLVKDSYKVLKSVNGVAGVAVEAPFKLVYNAVKAAASPFETQDPNISKSQPSYDTSVPGDPRSLPQKGSALDILKLKKIQYVFQKGNKSPLAVAHNLGVAFSSVADYKTLYSLLTFLANDDFTDGDFDFIARTDGPAEKHLLDQIPLQ